MKHQQTNPQDVEDAVIVNDERAEAVAKAKADLQAKWDERRAAFKPLPKNCTLDDLHAGLRERVRLSVFGSRLAVPPASRDKLFPLPCFRDPIPLNDEEAAALLLFIRRHHAAMSGTLTATGRME